MEKTKDRAPVSIILAACNNLAHTELCLQSLSKHTAHLDYELITVNNGSTDGTGDFLEALPHRKKISISHYYGMAQAFNAGLRLAAGEYSVLLTNEILLTPRWLDNLLTSAQSDPQTGMVVPVCNFAPDAQQIKLSYQNQAELEEAAVKYNLSDPRKWEERLKLVCYAVLMRTDVVNGLGGFDDIYNPGILGEEDLSFRLRRAGYKLILAGDTFVHRFATVARMNARATQDLMERNRRIFAARFGVDPWDDTGIDWEIVSLIAHNKDKGLHILGVGPRCGATLLQIKNRLRENGVTDVWLWSITEEEKYMADLASICEQAVCERLDNITLVYQGRKFDCIIVEHDLCDLDHPEKFLQDILIMMPEDGQLIFPLSNALFYANILNLLKGYPETGRDRINCRYINANNLKSLLQKIGFQELQIRYSQIDPPSVHARYVANLKQLMREINSPSRTDGAEQPKNDQLLIRRFLFIANGVKSYKKILLYPGYDFWQNGKVFDDRNFLNSLGVDTGENCLWTLRAELKQSGYNLVTLENPTDMDDAEFILFHDVPKYYGNHCFLGMYHHVYQGKIYFEEFLKSKARGKARARLAVFLDEPPVVMPENYDPEILAKFDLVFTYCDDLVDNKKFFKYYIPQPESVSNPYARDYAAKKLCTFVGSNKSSLVPGELYSERRQALLYFEQRHNDEFDFYGKAWDGCGLTCYRGMVENKLDTLSRYKFCICYENGVLNGWISEKIFDCFFAGCVPIYLGAQNVKDYIPAGTFIDQRDFADYDQLYDFISGMDEARYAEYQQNIAAFLKSEDYQKFTRRSFARNMVRVITASRPEA